MLKSKRSVNILQLYDESHISRLPIQKYIQIRDITDFIFRIKLKFRTCRLDSILSYLLLIPLSQSTYSRTKQKTTKKKTKSKEGFLDESIVHGESISGVEKRLARRISPELLFPPQQVDKLDANQPTSQEQYNLSSDTHTSLLGTSDKRRRERKDGEGKREVRKENGRAGFAEEYGGTVNLVRNHSETVSPGIKQRHDISLITNGMRRAREYRVS